MTLIRPADAPKTILIVIGTRPEAIKLFPVIHALQRQPGVRLSICVTGQHGQLVVDILAMAGITPDWDLAALHPGQSLDALLARLVPALGKVMDDVRPDWVLVHGDTLSALAGALAAHFRGIRIAHFEAGLRSGDLWAPTPEEAIRKMLAALAECHFAPTHTAAAALRAENVGPKAIYVTGNTGIDALLSTRAYVQTAPQVLAAVDALLQPFVGRRLMAVTVHRRENQGRPLATIAAGLAHLAARPDVALIYPLHPNPDIRRVMHAQLGQCPNVALIEPLDYPSFVALLDRVDLVLTDSGGIQEEAPALGKPVLVVRDRTERPEGLAAGTALLVGTQSAQIVAAVTQLLEDAQAYAQMARAHNPYGDGKAADQIARILVHES